MSEYLKDYAVQLIHTQPNDVILLHISEDLCMDDVSTIQHEIQQAFPNNTILVANENILKKITIFRADSLIAAYDIADEMSKQIDMNREIISQPCRGYSTYDVLY